MAAALRPPTPNEAPPIVPDVCLKGLSCRNQVVSLTALVTSEHPVKSARVVFTDLVCGGHVVPASAIRVRLVGAVETDEGPVCDPLYGVEEFGHRSFGGTARKRSGALGNPRRSLRGESGPGCWRVRSGVEPRGIEVGDVDLPAVHSWDFFLNARMNPGAVARRHGVEVWSDEHFELLRPYIEDLAEHGQKTAVVPVCADVWGASRPYPSAVIWKKRGDSWDFDFSVFDRYVGLHEECGIDKAIHCYSMVQCPGESDQSVIEYIDAATGQPGKLVTRVGDQSFTEAWSAFFSALRDHCLASERLEKIYIGFDEKPDGVMHKIIAFLGEYAPEFRIAFAGDPAEGYMNRIDDLSMRIAFDERGVDQPAPTERTTMGVAELLSSSNICAVTRSCPEKMITTFYVCDSPEFPNTHLLSPLVESRMMAFLALQGGYDGFLRMSSQRLVVRGRLRCETARGKFTSWCTRGRTGRYPASDGNNCGREYRTTNSR